MDFKAEPKTKQEILTKKKAFMIPRFQREFTWEKEHIDVLWDDLLENLILKDSSLKITEYFLGSLVLIDNDDDPKQDKRIVVDGQQRLTIITILLSALYDSFLIAGEEKLANLVFQYIITQDNNGDDVTLLETESPKPFFQLRIQQKEKDVSQEPNTIEEKKLYFAYNLLRSKLEKKNLAEDIKKRFGQVFDYVEILKIIRDQLLNCKVVYVSVKSMKDAYMIFEVLNAKGEPLSVVDLIKNTLFSKLTDEQPLDKASNSWKKIKNNIEQQGDIDSFYRHFWLSNYHFITEKKLYQDFTEKIGKTKKEYSSFLKKLEKSSEIYKKILLPNKNDWNTVEKLDIYYSLKAFEIFETTQVRTLLLALFDIYQNKKITLKLLKHILLVLENFHFIFTAVCSSRPSGLESRYSKYSIKIRNEDDNNKIKKILKEFELDMKASLPDYETFKEQLFTLRYTEDKQKDKKKIQYIFSKIERHLLATNELDILSLSIEHIDSQSNKHDWCGEIGNLLILGADLNSEIGSLPFNQKLEKYKESKFECVRKFCEKYKDKKTWNEKDVHKRTEDLAKYLYKDICKFTIK